MTAKKISELLRVYEDLEKTLRGLRTAAEKVGHDSIMSINVRKLILQLSKSKRKIEQKIGSSLVYEKEYLKKRFGKLGPKVRKTRTTTSARVN